MHPAGKNVALSQIDKICLNNSNQISLICASSSSFIIIFHGSIETRLTLLLPSCLIITGTSLLQWFSLCMTIRKEITKKFFCYHFPGVMGSYILMYNSLLNLLLTMPLIKVASLILAKSH